LQSTSTTALDNAENNSLPMDSRKIAQEIYNIDPNDALYAPVKEALDVIDECLDIHGSVRAVKRMAQ